MGINCKRTIREKIQVIFQITGHAIFHLSKKKKPQKNKYFRSNIGQSQKPQVQILALALFSCIALGKLLKLSVPWFSCVYIKRDGNNRVVMSI